VVSEINGLKGQLKKRERQRESERERQRERETGIRETLPHA
jgi:hypothetical protein